MPAKRWMPRPVVALDRDLAAGEPVRRGRRATASASTIAPASSRLDGRRQRADVRQPDVRRAAGRDARAVTVVDGHSIRAAAAWPARRRRRARRRRACRRRRAARRPVMASSTGAPGRAVWSAWVSATWVRPSGASAAASSSAAAALSVAGQRRGGPRRRRACAGRRRARRRPRGRRAGGGRVDERQRGLAAASRRAACSASAAAITLTPSGSSRRPGAPPSAARRATTTTSASAARRRRRARSAAVVLPAPPAPTKASVRAPGAEVGHHRHAAGERGADELLERARLREREPVGDGLADDVGGQRGAQAGGDEALLGAPAGGGRGGAEASRARGAATGAPARARGAASSIAATSSAAGRRARRRDRAAAVAAGRPRRRAGPRARGRHRALGARERVGERGGLLDERLDGRRGQALGGRAVVARLERRLVRQRGARLDLDVGALEEAADAAGEALAAAQHDGVGRRARRGSCGSTSSRVRPR